MNRKLLTLAVVAAIGAGLAGSVQAMDMDMSTGWFVNGNIGKGWYKDSKLLSKKKATKKMTYDFNLGWRFPVESNASVGLELGYTDLGRVEDKANKITKSPVINYNQKLSAKGLTVGVNGRFNLVEQWYVSARGGLFRSTLENKYSNVLVAPNKKDGFAFTGKKKDSNWYLGAGTGWNITSNFSVGVNFDYYKLKDTLKFNNAKANNTNVKRFQSKFKTGVSVLSASAEYRF